MLAPSPFAEQRQALTAALANYDSLATDDAYGSALAAAEHQIYLASKSLTTQVTPSGVFVLDQVFQVGDFALPIETLNLKRSKAMIHSATVTAIQLSIFDIVEQEITLEELAAKTGADELLLRESSGPSPA
jgi:hypothetical protein